MIPKEQAEELVHDIYYLITDSDESRTVALFFCKKHIEELKTLPQTSVTRFHIQFWTDTITEIKGL